MNTKEISKEFDSEAFRKQLKTERRLRDMTQAEVAEKLGVNIITYGKWELGKTLPSMENITKIANILGIDISSFYISKGKTKQDDSDLAALETQQMHKENLIGEINEIINNWDINALYELLTYCSGMDKGLKIRNEQ